MLKQKITEKLVTQIWQRRPKRSLFTDTGDHIDVVFPGRLCYGQGCDFQDAVIDFDGTIVSGKVEVHVKSSQWYAHGHHRDKRYNDIILHVVMWHDLGTPVILHNGNTIPTVCLHHSCYPGENFYNQNLLLNNDLYLCPSLEKYSKQDYLLRVICNAGQERFAGKVATLLQSLSVKEVDQVLFYFVARALGYDKNSIPLGKLVELLPVKVLEQNKDRETEFNRALLLGTAGLLPSQRVNMKNKFTWDSETATVERVWLSNKRANTMNYAEWYFWGVRPLNSPVRRVVALSYLISYYRRTGFLQGILTAVRKSYSNGPLNLAKAVIVPGVGYWANHFDFGKPSAKNAAIVGHSKALEITVNVLLPFAHAWAELNGELRLQKQATDIYLNYLIAPDNQITRFMKQQFLLAGNLKLTAPLQQGLIHIFNQYCRSRNCRNCIVSIARD